MTSSETAEALAHDAYAAAKRLKDYLKLNRSDHAHIYMAIQDAENELTLARQEVRKQRDQAIIAADMVQKLHKG